MRTGSRRVVPGHHIMWYAYTGGVDADGRREKIRKTSTMRGNWPGYDAECECGWKSNTGGAIWASVLRDVKSHKFDVTEDVTQIF